VQLISALQIYGKVVENGKLRGLLLARGITKCREGSEATWMADVTGKFVSQYLMIFGHGLKPFRVQLCFNCSVKSHALRGICPASYIAARWAPSGLDVLVKIF